MKWKALCAAIGALTTLANAASAQTRFLAVAVEGCDALRAPEIERVLRIELASVASKWRGAEPLRVELGCEGSTVRVIASDPLTDKRLSRDVTLLPGARDRERTLALIVSQLFLTSWTEILIEARHEAPLVVPTRAPEPAVVDEVRSATQDALGANVRPTVVMTVGPRIRSFDSPLVTAAVAVRPTMRVGSVGSLFVDLSYERGASSRVLGSVSHSLAAAMLGGGLRSRVTGPLSFEGGLMVGAAYVDVSGDPTAQAIGSSASGAVAQGALVFGPVLSLGAARIGLEIAIGVTLPKTVARVSEGEDVVLSGPFAGVSLLVGLGEDRR